jgi:hypothetical protein
MMNFRISSRRGLDSRVYLRLRRTPLAIETLENRCLLNGPATTAALLQLVGSGVGVATEAHQAYAAFTAPTPDKAAGLQHTAYAAGNAMNMAANTLSVIGAQGSTGPGLHLAGDSTHLMGALGHLGALESLPASQQTAAVKDQELNDAIDADSDMIAVAGDITGLFNGQAPKLVSDSLGTLHDGINFLHDVYDPQKGWGSAATYGDLSSLVGDVVGLIGDALGGDAGKQPLQITMVFPSPAPAVVCSGANFVNTVATFTDPNSPQQLPAGDYTALINWGDGSSSVGQVVDDPSGPNEGFDVIGSHTYAQPGKYPVSVMISGDGSQGQAEQDATIQPSITQSPAQAVNPGADLVLGQTFNGPLVSFLSGDDSSQILQGTTAIINWGDGTTSLGQFQYLQGSVQVTVTGSHTYSQAGDYSVGVQITGPDGSATSGTTTLSVAAQGLAVIGQDNNIPGLAVNGTLATFSDPDGDTNPSDYSATITWGDDTQPAGGQSAGQIVSSGNGGFSVVGSYTYAHPGQYSPTVTVADNADGYGNSVQPQLWVGANLAAPAITAAAGQTFTGPVATFSWNDPNAKASDFQAAIHWGDGSGTVGLSTAGDPNVQIVSNGNGAFSILGSHTYYGNGVYSVVAQLFPPGYGSSPIAELDATGTATVGPTSLTVTAQNLSIGPSANSSAARPSAAAGTDGGSVNGVVATFTAPPDDNASNLTATINWGDGNTSTGQVVANSNGAFNVIGSHAYAAIDRYLTSVQVSDTGGDIASAFGLATPPPPTSSVNPLPATVNSPSFTVSWSGSDPNGPGIASYTIYVSDNGGVFTPWLTGTTQTSATYTGQFGHTYGFYSAATDALGLQQPTPTAAQARTLVPVPPPPQPTTQVPALTSGNTASFTVGQSGSFTVTATGSPTPSLTESGPLPGGVTFHDNGNGTATLSGTPAVGTAGTYNFTITAHNGVGNDATQNFALTVNQAPAITSTASITFTGGSAGSFTVTATGSPTPSLTVSGSLPAGVTFMDNGNGTATLSGTPAAGTAGSYTFTITAHNGIGSDASQSFTLSVNPPPPLAPGQLLAEGESLLVQGIESFNINLIITGFEDILTAVFDMIRNLLPGL